MRKWIGIVALSPVLFACAYQKLLRSKDFALKLKKANEYYDKHKYDKAQNLYYEVSPYYKSSDQYEFIVYRYAYCSFLMQDYQTSQMMFKDYLSNFPTSTRNEEVEYMQAKSYYLQSVQGSYYLDGASTVKAINLFKLFLQNHPETPHYAEAMEIIARCEARLETKDLRAAQQYYNMEKYKAAGIYFAILSMRYSESPRADSYKLQAIASWFKYAEFSVLSEKRDRYQQVLKEYGEFVNRFPESKYAAEANVFYTKSLDAIHHLSNSHEPVISKY